jgi:hypothetical protein
MRRVPGLKLNRGTTADEGGEMNSPLQAGKREGGKALRSQGRTAAIHTEFKERKKEEHFARGVPGVLGCLCSVRGILVFSSFPT